MKPSQRSQVEPFRAMNVVAKASVLEAQGHDIVMMCVGQPGSPAPTPAREAAKRAIEAGKIGYTDAAGIAPLRARLARYYLEKYQVDVAQEQVFVTTGSSAGFILSFLAAFESGDRVAIPSPGYPAYRNILRTLSLEPVEIETSAASNWVITPELLDAARSEGAIQGILIANPNNPNGTMMEGGAFTQLVTYCQHNNIRFISDEIYHGLTYTKPEVTALSLSNDVFVINSFSKYFCMTGWRIGWMVVPPPMIETINRLQQNAFICAPEISQIAALHAFDGLDEMELVKEGYVRNRNLTTERLRALGIKTIQPVDGAFYAYADITPWLNTSRCNHAMELAENMLNEASVALTPGIDFDKNRGANWMRFSFAGEYDRLVTGFDNIRAWL